MLKMSSSKDDIGRSCALRVTEYMVTGRHSQGSPLPGCVYEHTMLFSRSIYGRCCSAEIYIRDAVLLKYIRAMLFFCVAGIYKSDAGTGDPWE